jgi:fructose-bisphosphate aldolase class 1
MSTVELERTARAIVAEGKGILAADETPGTLTKRFEAHRIESTPDSRRAYRELFFTTAGIAEYVGGDLSLINQQQDTKPWKLSFSYGRALQDEALTAWAGRQENVPAAQPAFYNRARCDASAALGRYLLEMENASAAV